MGRVRPEAAAEATAAVAAAATHALRLRIPILRRSLASVSPIVYIPSLLAFPFVSGEEGRRSLFFSFLLLAQAEGGEGGKGGEGEGEGEGEKEADGGCLARSCACLPPVHTLE